LYFHHRLLEGPAAAGGVLTRAAVALAFSLPVVASCAEPATNDHPPDAVLQRELGLTPQDVVYTIRVTGRDAEVADPAQRSVEPGAWVQFVSEDWLVHEVLFETDSLRPEARSFLERTRQLSSPPLLQRDARFVVSFEGAPPGRYPFRLEGNRSPGRGVIVVSDSIAP
jgi:plastocyanin